MCVCVCVFVCMSLCVCLSCSRVHVLSWWFEVITNTLNIKSPSGNQSLEGPLAPLTLRRSLHTSDLLTLTSRSTKEKEIFHFWLLIIREVPELSWQFSSYSELMAHRARLLPPASLTSRLCISLQITFVLFCELFLHTPQKEISQQNPWASCSSRCHVVFITQSFLLF